MGVGEIVVVAVVANVAVVVVFIAKAYQGLDLLLLSRLFMNTNFCDLPEKVAPVCVLHPALRAPAFRISSRVGSGSHNSRLLP